ncbi:MAG: hypothetical protein KF705_13310 [Phycisphaeraceae bacterium]|nr:hypothetical protein [Phycisphaeraceae bacterium]
MARRRNMLLNTRAHALLLLPRIWLGADLMLDAIRALGVNHHLGVSRIERCLSPFFSGYIPSPTMHAIAWTQACCAVLVIIGLATRIAVLPAFIAIGSMLASWNMVGTLGTARSLDATSRSAALLVVGILLLALGAGRLSIDAYITRGRSRRR